jgi:hypothetical protein
MERGSEIVMEIEREKDDTDKVNELNSCCDNHSRDMFQHTNSRDEIHDLMEVSFVIPSMSSSSHFDSAT